MSTGSLDVNAAAAEFGVQKTARILARSGFLVPAAVLTGLFALAVCLQILSGAFHSELCAYPDEPSHYVTSLMVREYLTGPHPFSPLKFAEDYYRHYPKVAIGHWPPVFYFVQAGWMLLFSASRISIRLEVAFTTALLAFSFWRESRRWFGNAAAILAAALLVCLPIVQNATDEEMAESLLVLVCFWTTVYFARYLDSGKRSDALWFGFYFSLAVLTKGNGWLLAFLPPVALLLTRKLGFLFQRSFWLGIFLVSVLCLPWQLVTLPVAERGWTGGSQPSIGYTLHALGQFFLILVAISGPILSCLIAIGIVTLVLAPMFSRPVGAIPACMFALLVGDWIFHSLVPAGVEDRKMIIAVPALIYFMLAGGIWLADRLPRGIGALRWRRALIATFAAVVFAVQGFSIPQSTYYGYIGAANFIVSDPKLQGTTVLVSSECGGEGLLISEVAMRQPRPHHVILRATKELAKVDWSGVHYRSLLTQPAELLQYLSSRRVSAVVFDTYRPQFPFPHQQLVRRTIAENPDRFELAASFNGRSTLSSGAVRIYRVRSSTQAQ